MTSKEVENVLGAKYVRVAAIVDHFHPNTTLILQRTPVYFQLGGRSSGVIRLFKSMESFLAQRKVCAPYEEAHGLQPYPDWWSTQPVYFCSAEMHTLTGFFVHPDENERMERLLAGTDNPLYDLVHELRYNPRLGLSRDLHEAKRRFTDSLDLCSDADADAVVVVDDERVPSGLSK